MVRNRNNRRRKSLQSSEEDPMAGTSNLVDAMLVIAVGLLIFLVLSWNMQNVVFSDMSPQEKQNTMESMQQVAQVETGEKLNQTPDTSKGSGEGYVQMGKDGRVKSWLAGTFVAGRLVQHQVSLLAVVPELAIHLETEAFDRKLGKRVIDHLALYAQHACANHRSAFLAAAEPLGLKNTFGFHRRILLREASVTNFLWMKGDVNGDKSVNECWARCTQTRFFRQVEKAGTFPEHLPHDLSACRCTRKNPGNS